MANWCNTTYHLSGEKALRVYDAFCKSKLAPNGYTDFYNIIEILGTDPTGMYLRGRVNDFNFDPEKEILDLYCETAWNELADWRDWIDSKFPDDPGILYTAEEPGCDIYITNDPSQDKYLIDDTRTGVYETASTLQEVMEYLEENYPEEFKSLGKTPESLLDSEEFLEKFFSLEEMEGVYVHEYEFVE